jgi:hypothetical protein
LPLTNSVLYDKDATEKPEGNNQGRDYTPIPDSKPPQWLSSRDLAAKKDENSALLRNLG